MSGSRLALVADDQRLAHAIQTHLQKSLGQMAFGLSSDRDLASPPAAIPTPSCSSPPLRRPKRSRSIGSFRKSVFRKCRPSS